MAGHSGDPFPFSDLRPLVDLREDGVSQPEVVLRRFEPGDEVGVNAGYNRVLGTDRTLAEWSWKFPLEPDGRPIMLALRRGVVLAHCAGAPVRFQVDGRVWPAAQVVEPFSTPDSQVLVPRRDLGLETVERFLACFGASGRYPLLFGFPGRHEQLLKVLERGNDVLPPQPIARLRRSAAPRRDAPRRLLYRAELARDWEPRLDPLWRRVRGQYPVAVVRDAERALGRLAGHPRARYHRFLVFPRFSTEAVAFVAFSSAGGVCRWVDLLWDHGHPGALDLLSRLGAQVTLQVGAAAEELWLYGDQEGAARLGEHGFAVLDATNGPVMLARSLAPDLDVTALDGRVYLTMADTDMA